MRKTHSGIVRKIAVAFMALALGLGSVPTALAAQVVSAPLSTQSNAMNGMVRVYLSSLGNPSSLNLTVVGNYSINGTQSLSSGESLTVGFSSSTGAITLTRGGAKTNMGTYFALRRHSATGTNGIKISQARVSGNPYPGDLSFQAVRQGNGTYKLYSIAHIYIENYLYGVLPYEMGNGANIEALKAQAVAARTYTVDKMRTRASGTYDVVDTTNDQVYNGTPSGNANCVAAVDATKGIVVKNGSNYTGTYYSASNGGQMESAANLWGSSGYGYLMVKDDPFDLANPDSVVKRATVSASCTSGGTNASLLALLKTKAISALNSAGYSASSGNTTLQTVKSITPHTPKYSAPSRLYTKMDFTLTASTQSKSSGAVTATVTVTCGIFTELESMLGMSIQSSTNELWTVAKNGANFVLEARRFGHGIGMSQRGAMRMGRMGYTYDQILGFYYNDCKRVRISFTNTILAPGSSQEQTTVEDPADFEEDDTGCTGVVKLVGSSSSLAIRNEKSLTGGILGVIANNSPVSVYASDGSWCFIRFGGIKGYVPANALVISGSAPASTDEPVTQISGFATVQANGYLNLRASGSSSATVLTTAPTGSVLTVFQQSGGWAQVQFGATVAYASTDFLAFSSTYPGSAASSGSMTATVDLEDPAATVNLRSAPSTSGDILAQLPHGTTVTVTRDDGSWSTVVYNGLTGYIVSSCLKFEGGGLEGGGQEQPGEPEPTLPTATVNTATGYIRQEADETSPSLLLVGMGQSVTVLEKGENWSQVRYEGVTGYMLTASLTFQGGTGGDGQGMSAIVATQSGSLNLRMEASAGSPILTTIPKGTQITVTSRGDTWSAVRYNGISGYVMTSFLQFTDQGDGGPSQPTDPPGGTTAWVATQSGSLNLRAEPRAGSAILTTIPKGATVTVHQRGAEWSHVTYLGVTGHVMTVFLDFDEAQDPEEPENPEDPQNPEDPENPEEPGNPEDPQNPEEPGGPDDGEDPDGPLVPEDPDDKDALYAVVTTVSGSLNLRQDILPGSAILARIPKGTTIKVTQKLAAWSQTTYAGQQGYVMNSYLTFTQGRPPAETGDSAVVTTASGTLNLRTEPSANAGIVLRIPQYATVAVQQRGSTWSYVSYEGRFGYVMSTYLTFSTNAESQPGADAGSGDAGESGGQGDSGSQTPPGAQSTAWVATSGGTLNLRDAASMNARVLTTIPNTTAVSLLLYGESWCQVSHQGTVGYAMTQFLRFAQGQNTADSSGESGQGGQSDQTGGEAQPEASAWVNTPSGGLNIRETMSMSGNILTSIPRHAKVTVLADMGEWSQVRYGDFQGYVVSTYLSAKDPNASAGADASGGSGGNASGGADASGDAHAQQPQDSGSGENSSQASGGSDSASEPANGEQPQADAPADAAPEQQALLDGTLKPVSQETFALIKPRDGVSLTGLWAECGEKGAPLAALPADTKVQVLQEGDTWCQVKYEDKVGYCLKEYLLFEEAQL
ncbi:MAG: SH3 domain-containing protein [Candidatus Limiplasma sp.]|nr:SH3 domain-containing protein [Candidatus Limiplasma sp.]